MGGLNTLTATEIVRKIAAGETCCEEVVTECLLRVQEREPEVQAWEYLPHYIFSPSRWQSTPGFREFCAAQSKTTATNHNSYMDSKVNFFHVSCFLKHF